MNTTELKEGKLVFDSSLIQPINFNRPGWTSKRLFRIQMNEEEAITVKDDFLISEEFSEDLPTEQVQTQLPERFLTALQVKDGLTSQRFRLEMDAEEGASSDKKIEFEGIFFNNHPVYFHKNTLIITKMSNSGAVAPMPYLSDVITAAMETLGISNSELACMVFNDIPNAILDDFLLNLKIAKGIESMNPNTILFTKEEQYNYFNSKGTFSGSAASVAEKLEKDVQDIIYLKRKKSLVFVFAE